MLRVFFLFYVACAGVMASERVSLSELLVQKVVVLGYSMQSLALNDRGSSFSIDEKVKKEKDELNSLPDSERVGALLLLSLFDPAVQDKSEAIRAWGSLVITDAPQARVFLDARSILGFKEQWSVIIANGNVVEKKIGDAKVLVCDELLSVRYANDTIVDKRPYQYLISHDRFICARIFWEKTGQFIAELQQYKPEQIKVAELGHGEIDAKRADILDGLWIKAYLLGWQGMEDPLQNEVATSLKMLKGRLCGAQVRGFQLLARGSVGGNENATVVDGIVDRFNGMYVYQQATNSRLGIAYLVRAIQSGGATGIWSLYLQSVISACREYMSGHHVAGDPDPIVYLLGCSDENLKQIMRNAFVAHLEKFIELRWNSILEHNATLNDDEFDDAIVSLCVALPGRRVPFLLEAQHFVKKGMMEKARLVLTSGVAAMSQPEEIGKMKFTLYSFDKQRGALVASDEAIARLEEITPLVTDDPDAVIELAQWYVKAGSGAKALAVLRAALKSMPDDAHKAIQDEIDQEISRVP